MLKVVTQQCIDRKSYLRHLDRESIWLRYHACNEISVGITELYACLSGIGKYWLTESG